MNRDLKRFRQMSILQCFENSKKPKTNPTINMHSQRELMGSAAEKRLNATKEECLIEEKTESSDLKSNLHQLLIATENSKPSAKSLIPDCEIQNSSLIDTPPPHSSSSFQIDRRKEAEESSQELFPDSDLFQDSEEILLEIEEYSSQQSTSSIKISSLSCNEQSQEIFSEVDIDEESTEVDNVNCEDDEPDTFLNRKPQCSLPLSKLEPLENHSILFFTYTRPGDTPRPFPSTYRDAWGCDHVRMPCSPQNRYPIEDVNGEKQIKSRWDLINKSLRKKIQNPTELEEAIMSYNAQYKGKWNFNCLHTFFNTCFTEDEFSHFFEVLLPAMINIALNLPNICTQPIPLLKKNKDHYVTISQKQIGCLLLNAFFCTFPRRNFISRNTKQNWSHEYISYPDINFNRLFFGIKNRVSSKSLEKLKCIINYFRRITSREPKGTVTFHRQFLKEIPKWHESTHGLASVLIRSEGLIESDGHGLLQVDFANKFVGGGILGQGCVQEEIRFLICPELIASRLFTEVLGPTEALIITGVEQYNKYSGYSDTFIWEGDFKDHTPRDAWGRRATEIVAIDATHFKNTSDQFQLLFIKKELTKAFCGFYEDLLPENLTAVATGNWGCGAFKGNSTFKFLIQLMACSEAKRDMLYFTFGNKNLMKELKNIYSLISGKNLTVGDLWRILLSYSSNVKVLGLELRPKLYEYLNSVFTLEDDGDTEMLSTCERLIQAVENDSDTDIENNNETLLNDNG